MKDKCIYESIKNESDEIMTDDLKGNLLLIVNVAIDDPRTPVAFETLTKLNKKYRDEGLRILAFPCFQFGLRKTRDELVKYVKENGYDIGHIMREVEVNGSKTSQLYVHLKEKMPSAQGFVLTGNFTYFFADRRGKIIQRLPGTATYHELDDIVYQLL